MSQSIKDLDGLPSGEIKLLVSQAELRIMDAVDEKFAVQDKKLDAMQDDMSILVGNTKLEGLMQGTKKSIDALTVRHDSWHSEDLTYRSEMKSRLTTLETDTKRVGDQVSHVRWLVYTSYGLGRVGGKCLDLLKSETFWKVAGCGLAFFMLEKMAPALYHWILPILQIGQIRDVQTIEPLVYTKQAVICPHGILRRSASDSISGHARHPDDWLRSHRSPTLTVGMTIDKREPDDGTCCCSKMCDTQAMRCEQDGDSTRHDAGCSSTPWWTSPSMPVAERSSHPRCCVT